MHLQPFATGLDLLKDDATTGHGFDYFYGVIAGETSQWEPALWENTNPISPPHVKNHEDYHLTEAREIRNNTLVIYILSDNGASAEGMNGSIAELNAQNGRPSTVPEHMEVLEDLGGLSVIGGPRRTICTTRHGRGPRQSVSIHRVTTNTVRCY